MGFHIARVYYAKSEPPAGRFLVDRLWPRGLAKADAPFEQWLKDIAPSPELRKWYSHDVAKYDEFATRYRSELEADPAQPILEMLKDRARTGDVILLTATTDLDHSGAAALSDVLSDYSS